MAALKTVIMVLFILISVFLVGIVLVQDGESGGLSGAVSGGGETFWSKNKGRSMEGALEHFTRYGAIVFMVITLILNVLLEHMG